MGQLNRCYSPGHWNKGIAEQTHAQNQQAQGNHPGVAQALHHEVAEDQHGNLAKSCQRNTETHDKLTTTKVLDPPKEEVVVTGICHTCQKEGDREEKASTITECQTQALENLAGWMAGGRWRDRVAAGHHESSTHAYCENIEVQEEVVDVVGQEAWCVVYSHCHSDGDQDKSHRAPKSLLAIAL